MLYLSVGKKRLDATTIIDGKDKQSKIHNTTKHMSNRDLISKQRMISVFFERGNHIRLHMLNPLFVLYKQHLQIHLGVNTIKIHRVNMVDT